MTGAVTPRIEALDPHGSIAQTRSVRRTYPLRFLASLVGLALAAHASLAGLSFVWCAPMQAARLSCCCPVPRGGDEDRISRTCCEDRTLAQVQSVIGGERAPALFAAALVAVASLFDFALGPSSEALAHEHDPRARAGPGERVHARTSVYLL